MVNPFKPGNGIEPPFLAGRDRYITEFRKSLTSYEEGLPRNMVLYGMRGTGKTVLMQTFGWVAKKAGWAAVLREFNSRYCDEASFAEAVTSDVVQSAAESSFMKKVEGQGKRVLGYLKPEEVSAYGISYKPYYAERKQLLEDYLKDILVNNWKIFEKSGKKGLIFLYDEFHSVFDDTSGGNFPISSMLSALSYAQREGCRYYLALAGLPNLTTNLKDAKTYTERMFGFLETGNLQKEECRKAIQEPLASAKITFSDALVDRVISETKGYPYFVQFYCYYLIDNTPKERIDLDDYEKAEINILESLDRSFFNDRFARASDAEQGLLLVMARIQKDPIKTSDILEESKEPYTLIRTYLKRLVRKGLIYRPRRGEYRFSIPLFRDFLLRHSE